MMRGNAVFGEEHRLCLKCCFQTPNPMTGDVTLSPSWRGDFKMDNNSVVPTAQRVVVVVPTAQRVVVVIKVK